MAIVLGKNSQILIINNTLINVPDKQYYLFVNYFEGDITFIPQKKEKRRWKQSSTYVITSRKVTLNFDSLWVSRLLEDWYRDDLSLQVTLDVKSNNPVIYNIDNVNMDNLKIDLKQKDFIKLSGTLLGVLRS